MSNIFCVDISLLRVSEALELYKNNILIVQLLFKAELIVRISFIHQFMSPRLPLHIQMPHDISFKLYVIHNSKSLHLNMNRTVGLQDIASFFFSKKNPTF